MKLQSWVCVNIFREAHFTFSSDRYIKVGSAARIKDFVVRKFLIILRAASHSANRLSPFWLFLLEARWKYSNRHKDFPHCSSAFKFLKVWYPLSLCGHSLVTFLYHSSHEFFPILYPSIFMLTYNVHIDTITLALQNFNLLNSGYIFLPLLTFSCDWSLDHIISQTIHFLEKKKILSLYLFLKCGAFLEVCFQPYSFCSWQTSWVLFIRNYSLGYLATPYAYINKHTLATHTHTKTPIQLVAYVVWVYTYIYSLCICLAVIFFTLILLGVYWVLRGYKFKIFIVFGKCLVIF